MQLTESSSAPQQSPAESWVITETPPPNEWREQEETHPGPRAEGSGDQKVGNIDNKYLIQVQRCRLNHWRRNIKVSVSRKVGFSLQTSLSIVPLKAVKAPVAKLCNSVSLWTMGHFLMFVMCVFLYSYFLKNITIILPFLHTSQHFYKKNWGVYRIFFTLK